MLYLVLVVFFCLTLGHGAGFAQEACPKYFPTTARNHFIPVSSPAQLSFFERATGNLALRKVLRHLPTYHRTRPAIVPKPTLTAPPVTRKKTVGENPFAKSEPEIKTTINDKEMLSRLQKKVTAKESLTREDILFMYQLERPHKGLSPDDRYAVIRMTETRNIKEDIAWAMNIKPSEVSLNEREAVQGGIKVHYGQLDMRGLRYFLVNPTTGKAEMPELVVGTFYFPLYANLYKGMNFDDYVWPKRVHGDFSFSGAYFPWSHSGWTIPIVTGKATIYILENMTGTIKVPDHFPGHLILYEDGWKVKLPPVFPGSITYRGREIHPSLQMPVAVGGTVLIMADQIGQVVLPEYIGGNLIINYFGDLSRVTMPNFVGESIYLSGRLKDRPHQLPPGLNRLSDQIQWGGWPKNFDH